ncbi:phosphatase PAP2 family protein [Amycolatopsis minnesotensis]
MLETESLYLDIVDIANAAPAFVRAFAAVATQALLVLLALVCAVNFWRARSRSAAAVTTAALAPVVVTAAYLVSEVVKTLWQEDRPCRARHVIADCPEYGDWSFPSNHAVLAGAAAVAIVFANRRAAWIAVPVALLAAASRVFVGVHYPHDVLVGLLLGAAVATMLPLLARPLTPVVARLRSRLPVVLGRGPGQDTPTVRIPRVPGQR